MNSLTVKTIEIAGLDSALRALRLSYGKEPRSITESTFRASEGKFSATSFCELHPQDIELLSRLKNNGDEHAKVLRGVLVWCEINAPRYWWQEAVTYDKIGAQCLMSESTMHIQGKGLPVEELVRMKEELPEGTMQRRIYYFSYQTLRRIYRQRRNHRLPAWRTFTDWIGTLPFAKEFILPEEKNKK